MKFYNREKEIKLLANIQEAADENAQMVTPDGAQTNWEKRNFYFMPLKILLPYISSLPVKPSHYCAVTL